MTARASACLLAVLALGAGPTVLRHDRSDEQARKRGAAYPMAVRVSADGCGTLIAPRWVLTAAHVARGVSPFEPVVHVGDATHRITRVVLHPEAQATRPHQPPKVDMALLELDEPVEGIPLAELYRGEDELGREALVVGYGDFGPGGGELSYQDGRRRAVTNVVDDAGRGRLVLTFDAPPAGTELEGMGGPGDSGGPLLLIDDDTAFVAGVSSASMGGPPGTYGSRDLYVRVSSHAAWIDATLADPPPTMLAFGTPRDLATDGFPDTPEGRLVEAFFAAVTANDTEQLVAFSRDHRLSGARNDRPDAAWATMIAGLRDELGPLRPVRLATGSRGELKVQAEGHEGRDVVLGFLIQQRDGPKLDGIAIRN